MKKFGLGLTLMIFLGCGDPRLMNKDEQAFNGSFSLDESGDYFHKPEMVSYRLSASHEGVLEAGDFIFDLSCNNVYGTGQNGDWIQNDIAATTSVSLPAGKQCEITLVSYDDGTSNYAAAGTPLVITVSTTGTITSGAASQYTSGGGSPIKQWFHAFQVSAYNIQLNYAADQITATTAIVPTTINIQSVSLGIAGILAPVVSNLTLYSLGIINGVPATYTLVATVTGSTGCKYIDNTANTYTSTLWSSVNTAYNHVNATTCPSFIPALDGSSTGNWTDHYGGVGQKTLIMWANTINGLSAYTTANF